MSAAVVDENVPIVANDATRVSTGQPPTAPQASDECRLEVVRYLRDLIATGTVVIDDAGVCLAKYRKYLSGRGQPGTGDAFLKHVFDNAYVPDRVEQVALAVRNGVYTAFPTNNELAAFDREDRIFVAVALTSSKDPVVANAVDSDYQEHAAALKTAGVKVKELCARRRTTKRPASKAARAPRRRRTARQRR
jgi:hypothetical protein